ncbi:MAG: NUDIX domain-containing protein, partial [Proteobacteria bacterium]|nr:NUDIX domain-containing protein [Pseudomonadota bacterium]
MDAAGLQGQAGTHTVGSRTISGSPVRDGGRCLGYYSRARNLHRAAKTVVAEHGGVVPQGIDDFRSLPGVGEYISAAVQSIAFHKPIPVVDGNVKRVLSSLLTLEHPVNRSPSYKYFRAAAEKLMNSDHPNRHNQAMMELGALVCKPGTPFCPQCPTRRFCRSFEAGSMGEYPKRVKAKATPTHRIAVGVVYRGDRFLITLRKPEGLLGGLWEFPGGKIKAGESAEQACLREIKEEVNLEVAVRSHLTSIKHAYSHFRIVMDVFICDYLSGKVAL